jgi:hypothetical protein
MPRRANNAEFRALKIAKKEAERAKMQGQARHIALRRARHSIWLSLKKTIIFSIFLARLSPPPPTPTDEPADTPAATPIEEDESEVSQSLEDEDT